MRRGEAVVGAAILVLGRAAPELVVGRDQRLVPTADLGEARAQRGEPVGEPAQGIAVVLRLVPMAIEGVVLVAVEPVERDVDHGQGAIERGELDRGAHGIAEGIVGKASFQCQRCKRRSRARDPLAAASVGLDRARAQATQLQQVVGVVHLHHAQLVAAKRPHGVGLAHVEHPEGDRVGKRGRRRGMGGERARHPAFVGVFAPLAGRECRLRVAVMLLRRLRVAQALHECQLARVPRRHERGERRVEAMVVRNPDHRVARDRDVRAHAVVLGIRIGHPGVVAVVAAVEIHHHEEALAPRGASEARRRERERRGCKRLQHAAAGGEGAAHGAARAARTGARFAIHSSTSPGESRTASAPHWDGGGPSPR